MKDKIFSFLKDKGIDAFLVGGSVRDLILGIAPKDWDFTTPILPDELIRKLPNIDPRTKNSSRFGTVFFGFNGETIEITTFRREILASRKPIVELGVTLEEDAKRRDFTINCLYMASDGEIIDPTGYGINDLKTKTLRNVGKAEDRMREDPLRILRTIRFISMGYSPEIEIITFLKQTKLVTELFQTITQERITEELMKIISKNPLVGLKKLKHYHLLELVIPEVVDMYGFDQKVPQYHKFSLFNHSVLTAKHLFDTNQSVFLVLIGFLHDIAKPICMSIDGDYYRHAEVGAMMTRNILKRLKFSNRVVDKGAALVEFHMRFHHGHSRRNLNKTKYKLKHAKIQELLALHRADLWASRHETTELTEADFDEIINPINGYDCKKILVSFNSSDIKLIKNMLSKSWEILFDDPSQTKEQILSRLIDYTRSKT